MAKKTLKRTDKKGREELWEWEHTKETTAALKELARIQAQNRESMV